MLSSSSSLSNEGKNEAIFLSSLAKSLLDDIVDAVNPSPQRAYELLTALHDESMGGSSSSSAKSTASSTIITTPKTTTTTHSTSLSSSTPPVRRRISIEILQTTKIGKILTKTIKSCTRHRRTSEEKEIWDATIHLANEILQSFKKAAEEEAGAAGSAKTINTTAAAAVVTSSSSSSSKSENATTIGLPSSVSNYRMRLIQQRKEMYKDPPSLPPGIGMPISIELKTVTSPPKRHTTTGELTFSCGEDTTIAPLLRNTFHPNRTPEEVLRAGSFGGTYFRPIVSAVTNVKYTSSSVLRSTVPPEWISELDTSTMITSMTYRPHINKYKVKCGGSLGMWESSGWIADCDPYGWFQWYCRFYSGRRCSDDARQISRWAKSAGVNGRFRSQLCNKILAANASASDARISPVIRQTLLHWGLEITDHCLEMHKKKK